jgi:Leucine-rich repeat (LRR) protein
MGKNSRIKVSYLLLVFLLLLGCSPGQNPQPPNLPQTPDSPTSPQIPDPPQPLDPDPYNCPPDTVIEIPDKSEFYPRLIAYFGKSTSDSITCGDLQSLTAFSAMSGGTIDLTGIEYAINLTALSLANVPLESLTPLRGLKKLKFLGSYVDALPLSKPFDCTEGGFRNLGGLDTLATLPALEGLGLQGYSIRDLNALENLTQLKTLNLRCNLIEDLTPLANLTQLSELVLGGNRITNLDPLRTLTNLTFLTLDRNCPKDVSALATLTNLQTLSISGDGYDSSGNPSYCPLSNFEPLKTLTELRNLEIINTNFSDLSLLLNFPQLERFDVSQNVITDISPLIKILEKGLPRQNDDWPPSVNLLGNNIQDLTTFAQNLPTFEADSFDLVLAYNCLDSSQAQNLEQLTNKGINLIYIEDQKPECLMRVALRSTIEPTFYWPN